MAELDYHLLCEYARIEPGTGLLTVVGGSFTRIGVHDFPAPQNVTHVARWTFEPGEPPLDMRVTFRGVGGMYQAEYDLEVMPPQGEAVEGRLAAITIVRAAMPMVAPGIYEVVVEREGAQIGRLAFEAVQTNRPD